MSTARRGVWVETGTFEAGKTFDLSQSSGEPEALGGTADIAFYGVEAESGRYITIMLLTAVPDTAGVDEHSDPSVFEYVTTRAPDEE